MKSERTASSRRTALKGLLTLSLSGLWVACQDNSVPATQSVALSTQPVGIVPSAVPTKSISSPTPKVTMDAIISVASGVTHSMALTRDGSVWAWGSNSNGQLGVANISDSKNPVLVNGLPPAKGIVAGKEFSLALTQSGEIWAWGDNTNGKLGDETEVSRSVPAPAKGLHDIVMISAEEDNSAAVGADGSGWIWGSRTLGPLTPQLVDIPDEIQSIVLGDSHSLALTRDGSVWAWGRNTVGQLGNGTIYDVSIPERIIGIEDVIGIACGNEFSIALTLDGTLWQWGLMDFTIQGDGVTPNQLEGTSQIPTPIYTFAAPRALFAHRATAFVLTQENTVWAWGANWDGLLGNGTVEKVGGANKPVMVQGLSDVIQVAPGYFHVLALTQSGAVWGWGHNFRGELGDKPVSVFFPSEIHLAP